MKSPTQDLYKEKESKCKFRKTLKLETVKTHVFLMTSAGFSEFSFISFIYIGIFSHRFSKTFHKYNILFSWNAILKHELCSW